MSKRYNVKFTINNGTAMHTTGVTASSARDAANQIKAREASCGRIAKIVAVTER